MIRSSVLGLWIGVLPGVGGSAGGIAAYAQAVQTSKHPETFGTGNVEGVIAPDATLGANEGGGLLPTLAFGIPGGDSMALLLIAFINMGDCARAADARPRTSTSSSAWSGSSSSRASWSP